MNKSTKRIIALALLALLLVTFVACKENTPTPTPPDEPDKPVPPQPQDPTLTDPVYDGSDVVVSQIVSTSAGNHIMVDGNDFLFVGTQIRVDAFMNCDKLDYEQVGLLFAEAAKLGVTCVQIPVEWAKIETEKDKFDFTYLFNILGLTNKYNLKTELLWFGTNMCGDSHSYTVPDYILRDGKTYPKFDALRTGEYWNYYGIMWFLDFDNPNLVARESNAIAKMMEYIYEYDSTHGGKKPVIGVQILNEPDIFVRFRIKDKEVSQNGQILDTKTGYEKIYNSLDALGKTVKAAKYKVYTRVNLASSTNADSYGNANGIYEGDKLKGAPKFAEEICALEGIDIVGDDSYTSSVRNIKGITKMFGNIQGNFGHIAENDGSYENTASLILAAVAQHGGYSLYDLLTSPFYVKHGTGNVDQGVLTYANADYTEFNYKKHYNETKTMIAGLKAAESKIYTVSSEDFAAFNIKTNFASAELTQTVSTTNVTLAFVTKKGAIGFAIDCGGYLVVFATADATLNVTDGSVTSVQSGAFVNGEFVADGTIALSDVISLQAGTLYRIDYVSAGKIASTTWQEIGG